MKYNVLLFAFFHSSQAFATEQEASVMWSAMGSRLSENGSPSITFGSGLGLAIDYTNRFTENVRVAFGYTAYANSSSLVLHGPSALLRYTVFGGRSRRFNGTMQTFTLERLFEISLPVGALVQLYDIRSVVQVDGLRKREATKLEGSAYSLLTGLEVDIPIQTGLNIRLGFRFSLGTLSEAQGSLKQLQTLLGIEKVL